MHVYVFLCVFYAFFDVILYNLDVHLEICLCVELLLHLLVLPLETFPDPIGQDILLNTTKYILMHIELDRKRGLF